MTVFASARPVRPLDVRRSWRGEAAFAVLVVALAPGLAFAQSTGKPLTIGLYASAVHDSNPIQGSQQAATLRGLQGAEWIFSPGASVTYARGTGRQRISLTGRAGYDFHQKNKTLNREHIDGTLDVARSIGSACSVGIIGGYSRAQSELQDLIIGVSKNATQTFRIEGSENCGTPGGLTQNLKVSYLTQDNSNAQLAGFTTVGVSGGLGYANRAIGNVALIVSHMTTSYNGGLIPGVPAGIEQSNLKLNGIGVQIERPIGSRLAGTAAIFYSQSSGGSLRVTPNRADEKFKGVTANASLTYRMGPRLRLAAQASRNVGGTSRPDQGYAVSTTGLLTAQYTVSSRISTGFGVERTKDDYRGGDPLVPALGPNALTVTSAFANMRMQIGRNSSLGADVRRQQGRADLALFDYNTTRISLTASTQF